MTAKSNKLYYSMPKDMNEENVRETLKTKKLHIGVYEWMRANMPSMQEKANMSR